VEYGSLTANPWDCNGDGVLDVQDANCTPADQINDMLAAANLLKGDADGNGTVEFPDFVILAATFGNPGQYTQGDFDKDGNVAFPDFVIQADNFGQSAGGAAAVPEPSTALLAVLSVMGVVVAGRRLRAGRVR
jgi:hypothetical protein